MISPLTEQPIGHINQSRDLIALFILLRMHIKVIESRSDTREVL